MGMVGLIVGALATGSGLLVLMTWLETSLQTSLAPAEATPAPAVPAAADVAGREQPVALPI